MINFRNDVMATSIRCEKRFALIYILKPQKQLQKSVASARPPISVSVCLVLHANFNDCLIVFFKCKN